MFRITSLLRALTGEGAVANVRDVLRARAELDAALSGFESRVQSLSSASAIGERSRAA